MKTANWLYEGPAFWGVSRITASMQDAQLLIYGAMGDSYPVSELSLAYKLPDIPKVRTAHIGRRELSEGTGSKIAGCLEKIHAQYPDDFIVIAPTSAMSLLKEDISPLLGNFTEKNKVKVINAPVHPLHDLEYSASEKILLALIKEFARQCKEQRERSQKPSVNIIGSTLLGFHAQEDLFEMKKLMAELGIEINAIIPLNAASVDFKKIPRAWFNISLCPEISLASLEYLEKEFSQSYILDAPVGIEATDKFVDGIGKLIDLDFKEYIDNQKNKIEINLNTRDNLKILVFGDYTHAGGISGFLSRELKADVIAGTFLARWSDKFKEKAGCSVNNILITDDSNIVNDAIKEHEPDVVLGTYNEWIISRKLNIPSIIVSAPADRFYHSRSNNSFTCYEGANNFINLLSSAAGK